MMLERARGELPQEVSEAELVPMYRVSRGAMRKLLLRFAAEDLVQRLPGHDWRFVDTLVGEEAFRESYEFRMVVECASLRSPNFNSDPAQLAPIRRAHFRGQQTPCRRRRMVPHQCRLPRKSSRLFRQSLPDRCHALTEQSAVHAGSGRL